eukprot:scaffold237_cov421-Prasinococcus_capsulatus_cf.AAC.6
MTIKDLIPSDRGFVTVLRVLPIPTTAPSFTRCTRSLMARPIVSCPLFIRCSHCLRRDYLDVFNLTRSLQPQLDDSFVTFDRPWDIVQVKSWLESTLRKTGPSFGEKARWAFEDLKASTEQFRRRLWRMMPRLSKDETRLVGTASLGLLVLMVLMSPKSGLGEESLVRHLLGPMARVQNWMRKMKKLMRPKSRSSDVDPGSFIDTPKSKAQKGTPKKKGKK